MKHTNKWDIDLSFGKSGEDRVANLLNADKSKIEVKTERDWWYKTGNIAIEIECRGKPSGLYVTEAEKTPKIAAFKRIPEVIFCVFNKLGTDLLGLYLIHIS